MLNIRYWHKAELIVLHVLDTNRWEFPSYYFFQQKVLTD
jgi:hypothetical protein